MDFGKPLTMLVWLTPVVDVALRYVRAARLISDLPDGMWREVSVARILRNFTLDPFAGSEAQTIVAASMLGVCLYAAAPLLLGLLYDRAIHPRVDGSRVQVVLRSVGWTLIVMAILASAPEPGGEFIYFQF